jgi:Mrp family chromosome partitioning ATPase
MSRASEQGVSEIDSVPGLETLTSPGAESVFAAMYDSLIASTKERYPAAVLVCCPSRREGATTIAAGLAIAASRRQNGDVLLVDCNTHHPAVLKVFGAEKGSGSPGLLAGDRKRLVMEAAEKYGCGGSTVAATAYPKLTVLSTTDALRTRLHCLESWNFRKVLDELSQVYSFMVIDGPPVNLHSESTFLSSQVDQVLLVLHSGSTRAPVAAKAAERLTVGERAPRIVLNRRQFLIPSSVYRRL